MPKPAPLEERLKACITLHPDWDDHRVARAIRGATLASAGIVRSGKSLRMPQEIIVPEVKRSDAASISIDQIRKRFDVVTSIRKEIERIKPGIVIPEREMSIRTAGKDYARFRRAVENNAEEFKKNRIKLKLDPDAGEGTWFWGSAYDVAEAIRLRDE